MPREFVVFFFLGFGVFSEFLINDSLDGLYACEGGRVPEFEVAFHDVDVFFPRGKSELFDHGDYPILDSLDCAFELAELVLE